MDWKNWPWTEKVALSEAGIKPANLDPMQMQALLRSSVIGNEGYSLGKKIDSQINMKDYHVAAAYSVIYTKVARFRKDIITEVTKLNEFYLTDVIVNQFADDALAPDVVTNEIVTVYSDKEHINKELEHLQDKIIDFDDLAVSITPDIITNGEYTLATKIGDGKEGLLELSDSVDQTNVIPLERNGEIQGFLVQEKNKLAVHPPSAFIKFSLSAKKVRIDLHQEFASSGGRVNADAVQLKDLPRFIRVGKSLLYPVRAKIKELELLEQLVPATKLSKLAQGTIVGVTVPGGFDVEQAMEVAKRVEGLMNKKVGVDADRGQISLENIMTSAGRLKCIPVFGDKGQIQKFDYKQDEPDELLASVNDTRRVICDSVGIPYELLFVSDTISKGELLRRYARYIRKLKSIQRAISEGILQVVYIHLTNKGIAFVPDDIKVDFKNKLVEIDNLNKLEFLDTTVGMLKSVKDFVTELADSTMKDSVRIGVLKNFMNEQLSLVGLRGLIAETDEEKHDVRYSDFPDGGVEPVSVDNDEPESGKPNPAGDKAGSSGSSPAAAASTGDDNGARGPEKIGGAPLGGPSPETIDIEDLAPGGNNT